MNHLCYKCFQIDKYNNSFESNVRTAYFFHEYLLQVRLYTYTNMQTKIRRRLYEYVGLIIRSTDVPAASWCTFAMFTCTMRVRCYCNRCIVIYILFSIHMGTALYEILWEFVCVVYVIFKSDKICYLRITLTIKEHIALFPAGSENTYVMTTG